MTDDITRIDDIVHVLLYLGMVRKGKEASDDNPNGKSMWCRVCVDAYIDCTAAYRRRRKNH
jgi:hypothetical protein